jgi:hypothetical protein
MKGKSQEDQKADRLLPAFAFWFLEFDCELQRSQIG